MSSVVSAPQALHDTVAGTLSISSTLPSRSVPVVIICQLKVRASGTTWRRWPMRTRTLVTGWPAACRFTAPAMASHTDSSCMTASLRVFAAVRLVSLAGQAVVETVAAVEPVGLVVVAADEDVVAVAAHDHVLAGAAGDGVVAGVAGERVAARAAVEVV